MMNLTTTKIYQSMFEGAGFQVECAGDGESAIATLKKSRPDAVLLDLILPKIHGIEVSSLYPGRTCFENTSGDCFFSNAYLASMIKAAWQAGASMSLTKANCTPEKLVEAVRMALSRAEADAGVAEAQPAGGASAKVPWPTRRAAPSEPRPALAVAPAAAPSPGSTPPAAAPKPAVVPPTAPVPVAAPAGTAKPPLMFKPYLPRFDKTFWPKRPGRPMPWATGRRPKARRKSTGLPTSMSCTKSFKPFPARPALPDSTGSLSCRARSRPCSRNSLKNPNT